MNKLRFQHLASLLAAALFVIAPIQCAFAKNDLEPYQKAAIATRFASEVKYNFAGYGRFAQNYDSICRAELPNLVNTQTDEEFSYKLQLFANLLKDGHTSIGFSADVTYAPISHKRIGDKVFVTGVFSDEYTQKGVHRGTELMAINDMPVIEYGNQYVVPYIPSSTEQWSNAYPFDSVNLTKGYRGVPVKLTFRNEKGKFHKLYGKHLSMKQHTLRGERNGNASLLHQILSYLFVYPTRMICRNTTSRLSYLLMEVHPNLLGCIRHRFTFVVRSGGGTQSNTLT